MNTERKTIIENSNIDNQLKKIGFKVLEGERITEEEGLILYQRAELGFLGMLADTIRERKNGNMAYYIRNTHIEPTNICIYHCRFCSYSARQTGNPWEFQVQEMVEKIKMLDPGIKELHMTGGVHPSRDLEYYGNLLKEIKKVRPELHVKAYSAVELDYMIKKSGKNFLEGLSFLKECGLEAIPGGGAEIFDEVLRKQICHDKSDAATWLEIHETAHQLGISSNATILYGHLENYNHRIDHMNRLRELQDRTSGFQAFIPLKFRNQNNEFAHIEEASVIDDMKNYAVSRIFLDNIQHLKAYWPALGRQLAQLSLSFGVDDLDGTINDSTKIYSLAGAEDQNPSMTAEEMESLITQAHRTPVERDGWYQDVQTKGKN